MEEDSGSKVVVVEKFFRKYFVTVEPGEVEGKGTVYVSPFKTLENPDANLFREKFQDIKKAIKGAMEDPRYRDQKKKLIREGVIKTKWKGDKVTALAVIALTLFFLVWEFSVLREAKKSIDTMESSIGAANKQIGDIEKKIDEISRALCQIILELVAVGKGEGYEHSFMRQLMDEPEFFRFKGDVRDTSKVRKWAQTRAHQIAILAGYVDYKTGREIRVKYAGRVSPILNADENGNIVSVSEYERGKDGSFKEIPVQVNELAPDYTSAKFLGDSENGVQNYEYIHQPKP